MASILANINNEKDTVVPFMMPQNVTSCMHAMTIIIGYYSFELLLDADGTKHKIPIDRVYTF